MKKKGLIVATIVMVLVLAVSLTTATYAWFTSDAKTTIDDISFVVGAGSDVLIGLSKEGKYQETVTVDSFVNDGNGDVTYLGELKWDGTAGLGSSINTGLQFNAITAAVGTGTIDESDSKNSTVDNTWVFANKTVKANGMGSTNTTVDKATIKYAEANAVLADDGSRTAQGDYLDIVLGIQASKNNLSKIVCNIVINPTGTTTTLGMNAALRARYCLNQDDTDADNWVEVDLYGTENKYSTKKNAITSTVDANRQVSKDADSTDAFGVSGLAVNSGAVCYSIVIVDNVSSNTAISVDTIYQLHLIIYLAGYDSDCINAAMGTASTIGIHFTTATVTQG